MLTQELKIRIEDFILKNNISKSKIEQELNMPKNCLSNFLKFKKIMPEKWVKPLENFVDLKNGPKEVKIDKIKKVDISTKKDPPYKKVQPSQNNVILPRLCQYNNEFDRFINLFNTLIENRSKNDRFLNDIESLKIEVKNSKKLNYNQLNAILARCNNVISGTYSNIISNG